MVRALLASEDPPFFLTFGLTAQRTQDEISPGNVWKVWEFQPPNPTGKAVVAIHGGGFILQPSLLQWIDYTDMARATGATVIVPLYPLSTTDAGSAVNIEPVMADFISQQIDHYGANNVSIYADPAGGTWAMGAVRELILRGDAVPASMVLLSTAADSSLTNPDIKTIDDPIFDVNNLNFYSDNSHEFDGITDRKDPRVSPLYMETAVLQALPPTTIYVGQREILEPDNLLLYQRAVRHRRANLDGRRHRAAPRLATHGSADLLPSTGGAPRHLPRTRPGPGRDHSHQSHTCCRRSGMIIRTT